VTVLADIAARAAAELGVTADDPRVVAAADAALTTATAYVYGSAMSAAPPPVLDLENPAHQTGLVALTVGLFLKPRSPTGSVESDTFTGDLVADDPMGAVHHLFDPARVGDAFGIA
jgi:hypothetical protein